MSVISEIPKRIEEILLNDDYFSNVKFVSSYSFNAAPNPITRVYISIELEEVNMKNLAFPRYLGSSNSVDYLGNYTDVVVLLDIYSPKNKSSNDCYDTFLKIYEVLSSNNVYLINNACCGKIEYDEETFCFKVSFAG